MVTGEAALDAGRRAAERMMRADCEVTRFVPATIDTATLNLRDDDPSDDLVYDGPCRIKVDAAVVRVESAEGQTLGRQDVTLFLPAADARAQRVRPGDTVTIRDGGPNPTLNGHAFRVAGIAAATIATALRFPVEHTAA